MTSSRLPIGVGQTTRLTSPAPAPAGPRPRSPASSPNRAGTIRAARATGGSARAATTSRAGSSRRSPAATAPPPMTTTSGSSALTIPVSPAPSRRPTSASTARAASSPSWASSVTAWPSTAPDSASRLPERRVRRRARRALARHADRPAGGQRLEAPAPGTGAGAVGAVVVHHQVAELARVAVGAAIDLPTEHQPAADAGPHRDEHGVLAVPRPRPRGARPAPPRCRRCPPPPAGPSRSAISSRSGTSSSGRWFDQRETPVGPVHQRRHADPDRAHLAGLRADVLDRPRDHLQRGLAVLAGPGVAHPRTELQAVAEAGPQQLRAAGVEPDDHAGTVFPARPPPGGCLPCPLVNDPGGGDKPEYKVYRSRPGRQRKEPDTSGLEALRQRNRPDRDRRPREPSDRTPITAGRVAKWVALAVGGWLLLSFLIFLVSAQTQTGRVRHGRGRADRRRQQPADRQQHPRAGLRQPRRRLDRREPDRARPRRLDPGHARLARQREEAVDPARLAGPDPRPRRAEDQLRLRARRHLADDQDRRGLPGQRPEDQPRGRGRLPGLPRPDRRRRRRDGEQQVEDLRARVRQLLQGLQPEQGRAPARRAHGAGLRARAQEPLRPGRERPRPRRPPAAGGLGPARQPAAADHVLPPADHLAGRRRRRSRAT